MGKSIPAREGSRKDSIRQCRALHRPWHTAGAQVTVPYFHYHRFAVARGKYTREDGTRLRAKWHAVGGWKEMYCWRWGDQQVRPRWAGSAQAGRHTYEE